jgi:hypothetical protein
VSTRIHVITGSHRISTAEGEGEGEVVRHLNRMIAQKSSDNVSNKGYISDSDEIHPQIIKTAAEKRC